MHTSPSLKVETGHKVNLPKVTQCATVGREREGLPFFGAIVLTVV